MQSKLGEWCAVFVQPHVVYCSVCKAVNGIHFRRNLMSGLVYQGRVSPLTMTRVRLALWLALLKKI